MVGAPGGDPGGTGGILRSGGGQWEVGTEGPGGNPGRIKGILETAEIMGVVLTEEFGEPVGTGEIQGRLGRLWG